MEMAVGKIKVWFRFVPREALSHGNTLVRKRP